VPVNFPGIDGATPEGNNLLKGRIDGSFTGTTDEIIQWGACKWGFDEDIVRAVAAQESWWRQSTKGDFNGSDYESYGLLQVRRTSHVGTYPMSEQSTPFNVDFALAWRRACYEGYFTWIPASAKGDEWGCIGLWYSGKWYDGDVNTAYSGANWYIGKVKQYLAEKPWLKSDF
jgi:autotransporter family porin